MRNLYSITDDDSNLTIGYCDDLSGLDADNSLNHCDESVQLIKVIGFKFTDAFLTYVKESKALVSNLYVNILSQECSELGSYYFTLKEHIHFHKLAERGLNTIDLNLTGYLHEKASPEVLKIWELWRKDVPTQINNWVGFSQKERWAWLEVVRLYHCKHFRRDSDVTNGVFHLNGTNIVDRSSFYCALGEAINGPGGYFGFNISSLKDCLRGSFGASPPFTICWEGAIKLKDTEDLNNFYIEIVEILNDNDIVFLHSNEPQCD